MKTISGVFDDTDAGLELNEVGRELAAKRDRQLADARAHYENTGSWPRHETVLVLPGTPVEQITTPIELQEWRFHRGMTQRDLAAASGLALTSINEIETGKRKPRPTTLRRLATALGTEDWNLYNHPRGEVSVLQAIRDLARLADSVATTGLTNGEPFGAAMVSLLQMETDDSAAIRDTVTNVQTALGSIVLPWAIGLWRETTNVLWEMTEGRERAELAWTTHNFLNDIHAAGHVDDFDFMLPELSDLVSDQTA